MSAFVTARAGANTVAMAEVPVPQIAPASAEGSLFIAGGSGAIGTMAIQIGRRQGWRVAASASESNRDYMLSPLWRRCRPGTLEASSSCGWSRPRRRDFRQHQGCLVGCVRNTGTVRSGLHPRQQTGTKGSRRPLAPARCRLWVNRGLVPWRGLLASGRRRIAVVLWTSVNIRGPASRRFLTRNRYLVAVDVVKHAFHEVITMDERH